MGAMPIPRSLAVTCSFLLAPLLLAQAVPDTQPVTGGAARLQAWEVRQKMVQSSPFNDLKWRALGPKTVGGRIESIDSPAGRPSVIYAGVGAGGVWKSINGGLTWKHVFSRESTFAVGDVTVDPTRPEVVWVGSGEAHLSGTSYAGTGVFKSTDGGETWRNLGLIDSEQIGEVLVDPTRPDTVFVAAIGNVRNSGGERGVYRSQDGGESWERVLFVGERVGIIDLAFDPGNPDRIYAAAWDRARSGKSGVYRSVDGGETWERLEGGLLPGTDVGRVAIDTAPSKPGVIYALMVDHSPPGEGRYDVGGALFRSDDGGDTWRRTLEGYVDTYVGWDFCDVRVAPDDADQVYICGLRLMVSRDGGATFERGGEQVFRLHAHPGHGMHLDMHDLWIDPQNPDRLLLGNDGGLYVSWDRARSWLHLNNLPIAAFYTLHLDDRDPFRIFGGTQDNASVTAPNTAVLIDGRADDWSYVFLDPWDGGDGFATFPDPFTPEVVYYEHQQGQMLRQRPGAPLRWGQDSGRGITPRAAAGEPELRFAWNTPLFASPHAEGVLYCAAERVFRSENRGDDWTAISDDLTDGQAALLSLTESPLDPLRLAAGSGTGSVFVTEDGGANWRDSGAGLPQRLLRQVLFSRHQPDTLYVALSGKPASDWRSYLYRSLDGGRTWRSIAANLPHEPVNVVAEDPRTEATLYVGTDLGVYASVDAGLTWHSLSRDLPTAPIVDLKVHSTGPTLVAVTHGLSAFRADVREIQRSAR